MILSLDAQQSWAASPASRGPSVALLQIAFPSLSHPPLPTPSKNGGETLPRQSSTTLKLRNATFGGFFVKLLTLWKLFLSLLGLFQSLQRCLLCFGRQCFLLGDLFSHLCVVRSETEKHFSHLGSVVPAPLCPFIRRRRQYSVLSSPISQMAKLRSGEEAAAEAGSLLSCLCRGSFQYLATESCGFGAGPEAPAVPGTSRLPTGSQEARGGVPGTGLG